MAVPLPGGGYFCFIASMTPKTTTARSVSKASVSDRVILSTSHLFGSMGESRYPPAASGASPVGKAIITWVSTHCQPPFSHFFKLFFSPPPAQVRTCTRVESVAIFPPPRCSKLVLPITDKFASEAHPPRGAGPQHRSATDPDQTGPARRRVGPLLYWLLSPLLLQTKEPLKLLAFPLVLYQRRSFFLYNRGEQARG